MSAWVERTVEFKFRLGELTLYRARRSLLVRYCETALTENEAILPQALPGKNYLARSAPTPQKLPRIRFQKNAIRYVPSQYQRSYVDLSGSFENYLAKFSSKTRSTLKRKIRRFAEYCGGQLDYREYKTPPQFADFHLLAREVSRHTYQERMFDMGLPESDAFRAGSAKDAGRDALRGYILFADRKPIAYLYCPVIRDTVLYQYLGYLPEYARLSPGTVLLLKAFESLFKEARFRYFDFTEGGGEEGHKSFFSTERRLCADIYYLTPSLANSLLVLGHSAIDWLSETSGHVLDRMGLKKRVRTLIRLLKSVK